MVGFSFVTEWWELVPLRLVLGLLEAGYFPGVVYLISTWYSRYDMGRSWCLKRAAVVLLAILLTEYR